MLTEFVTPNWHVIAIHFPIGLLGMGVLLEWLSFAWSESQLRTSARWMILIGALLAIPAAMLGIYAYRDVVVPADSLAFNWHEVKRASQWSDNQWYYMGKHVWLESVGTGLAVLAVVLYLAMSDQGRRKLYWPGMLVMTGALGLMAAGAWYSGEAVYRYGTGVTPVKSSPIADEPPGFRPIQPAAVQADRDASAPLATSEPAIPERIEQSSASQQDAEDPRAAWVERYLPPMQMHVLMAGLTIAFAMGAVGISIRRWSQPMWPTAGAVRVVNPAMPTSNPAIVTVGSPVVPATSLVTPGMVLRPVYAARFWVLATLFAVMTAAAGLWMTGDWRLDALIQPFRSDRMDVARDRLFWHAAFGVTIVAASLLLALSTRVFRRARFITSLLILVVLAAASLQVWMGILLLYDGPSGSLTTWISR